MKLRPATMYNVLQVEQAIRSLKAARWFLVQAGCPQSAGAVRSAIKSAEGALRHVRRREESTNGK